MTPKIFWFTGLSGSGKSTLAGAFHDELKKRGVVSSILDGDVLREGLCSDLGFSECDRDENQRRVAHVATLLHAAGVTVLVATISPLRRYRDYARALVGHGAFVEIFVSTPLEECERRDPKGLYKKARAGSIPHFTGLTAPYESPLTPEGIFETLHEATPRAVARLLGFCKEDTEV